MAKTVFEKYGKIDILVNSAGIAYLEDAVDFDEAMWGQSNERKRKRNAFALPGSGAVYAGKGKRQDRKHILRAGNAGPGKRSCLRAQQRCNQSAYTVTCD